ncbi:P-loop containing nucleoside triphosphate hydrolase protein [Podospora australis]|uniref:ATP-dependent RNA helicase n=1 Tax=Podospora australis TaxID=1536484 RepID=A0AAN6WRT7_9PEZI|nr:P-loop containing nucleoside triphosphate hydrolase protein [Podospora australis]
MYNRYIPPPKPKAAQAQPPARTPAAASPAPSQPPRSYAPPPPPAQSYIHPSRAHVHPQEQYEQEPEPTGPKTPSWLQPYVRRVDPNAKPTKITFGDGDDVPAPVISAPAPKIEEKVPEPAEEKPKKSKRSKTDDDDVAEQKPKKRKKESKKESKKEVVVEEDTPEEVEPIPEVPESKLAQDDAQPEVDGVAEEAEEKDKRKPKREKKKKKAAVEETEEDDTGVRSRHKAVFEKVEKALRAQAAAEEDAMDVDGEEKVDDEEEEPAVEHGLEPIPQPTPVVPDESQLTYETLPPWLASPIQATDDMRRPFEELGIPSESAKILKEKGFNDAFAVQTVVLPMLLPQPDRQGDLVIAAPTGSGKTLSYVLPMIQDLSYYPLTRLRAIIVLPTRDLVQQVQQACEACASAYTNWKDKKVRIGTAVGNKSFKEEQLEIMTTKQQYNPDGYERWKQKQRRPWDFLEDDAEDELDANDPHYVEPLPYHTVEHVPNVDILICTPGRLVDHIDKTRGFKLTYVRWLVVDEADKLLSQDYQEWLNAVLKKLNTDEGKPHCRSFAKSNKSGVRKVILSATMAKDISLFNQLKLSRPKLVVLQGTKAGEQSLPPLLKESAIKIRDPSLKPLYLVDLLNSLTAINEETVTKVEEAKESASETSDSESSSDSDSDSSSDSDSDSDSDSGSDSDSDSSSDSSSSSDSESEAEKPKPKVKATTPKRKFDTTVLIFTKSNEAALRLSRLLALLVPDLEPLIGTLTSSTQTSRRTRTLRAFSRGKVRILVASDLVSRGIDLLNLEHVINYDLPMSETSYVHRVGRTARAGRAGHSWTLLEHSQARRFWRDFAGEGKNATTSIMRTAPVERVRITATPEGGDGKTDFADDRVAAYEVALKQLQKEATLGAQREKTGA